MTHILQPLDVGIFDQIKRAFRARAIDVSSADVGNKISKATLAAAWSVSCKQGATPTVVKGAFARCGLYPFDPTNIDTSKITQRR